MSADSLLQKVPEPRQMLLSDQRDASKKSPSWVYTYAFILASILGNNRSTVNCGSTQYILILNIFLLVWVVYQASGRHRWPGTWPILAPSSLEFISECCRVDKIGSTVAWGGTHYVVEILSEERDQSFHLAKQYFSVEKQHENKLMRLTKHKPYFDVDLAKPVPRPFSLS